MFQYFTAQCCTGELKDLYDPNTCACSKRMVGYKCIRFQECLYRTLHNYRKFQTICIRECTFATNTIDQTSRVSPRYEINCEIHGCKQVCIGNPLICLYLGPHEQEQS